MAQVDLCPDEAGLVLSVGRVSLWLGLEDALDVAETLTRALDQSTGAASVGPESAPETEPTPPALAAPFRGPLPKS